MTTELIVPVQSEMNISCVRLDQTKPRKLRESESKLKRMNYFERLNVNPYASTEKIKESYYKQIKRFNNEVFPEHFLLIK
ncbi:hypothetical protein ACW7EJ_21350, partial [Acinetobacter soli]